MDCTLYAIHTVYFYYYALSLHVHVKVLSDPLLILSHHIIAECFIIDIINFI